MKCPVEPGMQLDGFSVGERLHSGGMGSVFKVVRSGSAVQLVMKVPHSEFGDSSESIVGFETEATIVPALVGPHVPRFVAAGDLTCVPYLVCEWVEGRTLEAMLANGPLSSADVARLGAALADALHSLHQQQVVHLDLKPGNVIFRDDGTAVLIDFGLAHHARYPDLLAEETRYRAGSAPYVSPEQLLGTREDPRSDLFALGVVLYESATGRLPFGEPDTDVRNRFWLDPIPPSLLSSDVPPWLQEIILRCLEPRAERRYQSAAHVAFDLRYPDQVVLTARATKARRAGLLSHARRFFRARREVGPRLESPAALLSQTPIVLVAIDTAHLDDERHSAIRSTLARNITFSTEFRLIALTVIPPHGHSLEHLVRLRHWAAPLRLPVPRLTFHAIEAHDPDRVIVDFAHHNSVDLIVLGAPADGARAFAQSVASSVSARARCSVHLVRVSKR